MSNLFSISFRVLHIFKSNTKRIKTDITIELRSERLDRKEI